MCLKMKKKTGTTKKKFRVFHTTYPESTSPEAFRCQNELKKLFTLFSRLNFSLQPLIQKHYHTLSEVGGGKATF